MRLHFSIGCYDCRRAPGSRQGPILRNLNPFLLIMCIDAPESTTNSQSSGWILDGEGRHHISVGEKNVVFFFSINFRIFFANFHAASRPQCSCHSVSSWDRSSNFGAFGVRWWGSPGQIFVERWISVSNFGRAQCGFGESNTSVRFLHGWALP